MTTLYTLITKTESTSAWTTISLFQTQQSWFQPPVWSSYSWAQSLDTALHKLYRYKLYYDDMIMSYKHTGAYMMIISRLDWLDRSLMINSLGLY